MILLFKFELFGGEAAFVEYIKPVPDLHCFPQREPLIRTLLRNCKVVRILSSLSLPIFIAVDKVFIEGSRQISHSELEAEERLIIV